MFAVSLSSIKNHVPRFRWPSLVCAMLAVWLAVYAVMAWQGRMRAVDSGIGTFATQRTHDFPQVLEKSWFSHANVSKRVYASIADNIDTPSAAPGSYFRVLRHIYGTSVDHLAPELDEQPMPLDDIATFHQLGTRMPLALARVTSEFGDRPNPFGKGHRFHRGIDLAAPAGTAVYAVAEGTVARAASDRTYGNVVVINHHNGYKTLYAHNAKLLVKVGDRVKVGQPIAKVGSTGRSTGAHLHFEIHRSGHRVDPGPYLAAL